MQIPILIEPVESGGFCARAGEPFGSSAIGETAEDAVEHLTTLLRGRLQAGARLAVLNVNNGVSQPSPAPLHLDPLPEDDWFFTTMEEAIAEHRAKENEADS